MKVFKENSVYVQINDLVKLLTLSDGVPDTILKKIHTEEEIIIDDNNRFDFIKFDLPEEVFSLKDKIGLLIMIILIVYLMKY